MRRSSFSLIELLAVVAVVAILAALGLPALQSAMESARQAECAQNLRQIGVGLFAYAADHNNCLPAATTNGFSGEEGAWGYFVWPYVYGSYANYGYHTNDLQMGTPLYRPLLKNIFRCPGTRHNPVKVPGVAQVSPPRLSYGLNYGPLSFPSGIISGNEGLPVFLAQIPHPPRTAMVTESSNAGGTWTAFFQSTGLIPHRGGMNVLYYDGHVAWLPLAAVPTDKLDVFWYGH